MNAVSDEGEHNTFVDSSVYSTRSRNPLGQANPPASRPPPDGKKKKSHNLALLLLKTGPTGTHSPVSGGKQSSKTSADDKWQWEKVKPSNATSSSETGLSSSLFKGFRMGGGGGNGAQQANGAGPGGAGGGGESYRWRHTEAIKLLERALAVHREVSLANEPTGGAFVRGWGVGAL